MESRIDRGKFGREEERRKNREEKAEVGLIDAGLHLSDFHLSSGRMSSRSVTCTNPLPLSISAIKLYVRSRIDEVGMKA